jgi:hypothetical protein
MSVEKITCKFCGKTRNINVTTHGGTDFYGRNLGLEYTTDNDQGCSCQLGQAAFQQYKIKKMCLNCKYMKLNRCTNAVTKSEICSQFDVKELAIKDSTKNCKNWEIESEVFKVFTEAR